MNTIANIEAYYYEGGEKSFQSDANLCLVL